MSESNHHASKTKTRRPDLATRSRLWQTDRPPLITSTSLLPPALRRGATNTSLLNEAIRNRPTSPDSDADSHNDDSRSSSSDEQTTRKKSVPRSSYSRFDIGNDNYNTKGRVSKRDGRLNICIKETHNKGYLAKALGKHLASDAGALVPPENGDQDVSFSRSSSRSLYKAQDTACPRLNIVVMVIGSRGDIQPFLKIGKNLKQYGHRVRIATHPAFRDFVQNDSGLEFFSVGGDPAELMAFMVKNPGMIPSMSTLSSGEVGRRRLQMSEMFEGFWRACINATDCEKDVTNLKMMSNKPFIADAIIANPPCFAHIHCAERLGIPLHLMFTFPYTPTQSFPHPLASIKKTNVDPGYTNFISYPLVEMVTWQGLGDLVNAFRVKTLGLEPVSTLWAPGQLYRLKVPYTYLWSPGLVPKPKDWGPEIDISGFVFLDLASTFTAPKALEEFLNAGEPPIYIGFGSIVVDNPDKFTQMIFEAVNRAGVRALISKGWGGLGQGRTPDNIFLLDNTPHDWLFPKVRAVVHHGGAGTSAIGLKCGKPTMVIPFFGDQMFWGAMIGDSGAGARAVPYKNLDVDRLAQCIKDCLTDEALEAAKKIAIAIEKEGDGAANAVKSFHRSLKLHGQHSMRCSILEDRVAVWQLKKTILRLSALAAELLVEKKEIHWKQLRLIRHCEWNDFEGPGEPVSGTLTALSSTLAEMALGVGSVPFKIAKGARRRSTHEQRTKGLEKKKSSTGVKTPPATNHLSSVVKITPKLGGLKTNRPLDEPNTLTSEKLKQSSSNQIPQTMATNANPMDVPHQATIERAQPHPLNHRDSSLITNESSPATFGIALDIGTGIGHTAAAMARAPMDLSLAIAQGFHNAPRLYGDTTVRRTTRITGFHSGIRAARQEFAYGIYDGVTGLWNLPYKGMKDGGTWGFVKGCGLGLGGFVLKDISALVGPWGYGLKGLEKELVKGRQTKLDNFIRKARIIGGQSDLLALGPGEDEKKRITRTVIEGWEVFKEVRDIVVEENMRKGPVKGRWEVFREIRKWKNRGDFDNIRRAEKALQKRRVEEGSS